MLDAMATWLNHVGIDAQQKQAFELMQTRLVKPETSLASQVLATFHDQTAADESSKSQAGGLNQYQ